MACMYLLFGVVVVDNWYLHKIQNRYPQHYPTYHLVYQESGMAKFEKYSEGKIIFKNAQLEKNAEMLMLSWTKVFRYHAQVGKYAQVKKYAQIQMLRWKNMLR